ncbi:MAG: sulfotransferase domain-containing protein [Deltaproteobacteria bacterium]|jgi:hypothetical protein|nr:sulfotransferase domain-containing protein [Deltaproteobacteria bacterium]
MDIPLKLSAYVKNSTTLSKVYLKLLEIGKSIYHQTTTQRIHQMDILFIIGCQRSGTDLILRIFSRDLNTTVYNEGSILSFLEEPKEFRLRPFDSVKRIIEKNRAPLIILKPLVETQNILKLLSYFEGSKALWMYRHYKDVTMSNLKRFGVKNGINNLRPIIENEPQNWRSEYVPERVKKMVLNHFSEDMNPFDAAALFWVVRNSLFFDLNLDKHPDVMMCKYEELVSNPLRNVKKIYEFMSHDFPRDNIVAEVNSNSLGKGENIKLTPEIDRLCNELLEKLNASYISGGYEATAVTPIAVRGSDCTRQQKGMGS